MVSDERLAELIKFYTDDAGFTSLHTLNALRELVQARANERRLREALNAACVIAYGRACFKTSNGVPMGMPRKAERIVRAALAGEGGET